MSFTRPGNKAACMTGISSLPLQKQLSLQEAEEPQSYPTTTSLPRQHTIGEIHVCIATPPACS